MISSLHETKSNGRRPARRDDVQREEIRPDRITFNSVLNACRVGGAPREASGQPMEWLLWDGLLHAGSCQPNPPYGVNVVVVVGRTSPHAGRDRSARACAATMTMAMGCSTAAVLADVLLPFLQARILWDFMLDTL